jgi:hypothetical protein
MRPGADELVAARDEMPAGPGVVKDISPVDPHFTHGPWSWPAYQSTAQNLLTVEIQTSSQRRGGTSGALRYSARRMRSFAAT